MRKIKFLSVLLIVCLMLSTIPIMTVGAVSKDVKSATVTKFPDNFYKTNIDDLMYGTNISVAYTDGTTRTVTCTKTNTELYNSIDYTEEYGYTVSVWVISISNDDSILCTTEEYLSDIISVNFFALDCDDSIYKYPDSYKCPEVFCKDYFSYKTNKDNTLTMQKYVGTYSNLDNLAIPETVYDKTVTCIDKKAILDVGLNPKSITLPKTITNVGDYAFGYTVNDPDSSIISSELQGQLDKATSSDMFDIAVSLLDDDYAKQCDEIIKKYFSNTTDYKLDSDDGYIYIKASKSTILSMSYENNIEIYLQYEIDAGIYSIELSKQLQNANDNDMFDITISLFDDDYTKQGNSIIKKYFTSSTKYEFDSDDGYIYTKASKATILSMKNEQNIEIYLQSEDTYQSIDSSLIDYLDTIKDTDTIKVTITLYSVDGIDNYDTLAKNISKKYFNGTTNYSVNKNDGTLTIEATKKQILSINNDESVYVEIYNPENMTVDLYLKLNGMNDNDELNIMVNYTGLTPAISFGKWFPNCEYTYDKASSSYIINNVTKAQIMAVPTTSPMFFFYHSELEPTLIKDFVVYGYKNTAVQAYAVQNGLKFIDVSGDYIIGDVNLDGKITINDCTLIQKYLANRATLSEIQLNLADFNKDGKININDATAIQKQLAGRI